MRSTLVAVEGGIPHANFSFSSVLLFFGFKRWEKKCDFTFITAHSSSQAWAGWVLKNCGTLQVQVGRSFNLTGGRLWVWEEAQTVSGKIIAFEFRRRKLFFHPLSLLPLPFRPHWLEFSRCISSQHYHGMEYAISINGTEKIKLNRRIFIVLFYFLLLVFLDVPLPLRLLSAATLGWYESFAKGAQAWAQLSFAFGVCFL